MNKCILHAGIPKTGSTSIQYFLAKELDDPGFLYFTNIHLNGCRELMVLFSDFPEKELIIKQLGWSAAQIATYKQVSKELLEKRIAEAKQRGASLHFHSSLFASFAPEAAETHRWLTQRMGIPFEEDPFTHDQKPEVLRQESDMYVFDQVALDWLAAQIGRRPIQAKAGKRTARRVAMHMYRLRMKFATQKRSFVERLRARWFEIKSTI